MKPQPDSSNPSQRSKQAASAPQVPSDAGFTIDQEMRLYRDFATAALGLDSDPALKSFVVKVQEWNPDSSGPLKITKAQKLLHDAAVQMLGEPFRKLFEDKAASSSGRRSPFPNPQLTATQLEFRSFCERRGLKHGAEVWVQLGERRLMASIVHVTLSNGYAILNFGASSSGQKQDQLPAYRVQKFNAQPYMSREEWARFGFQEYELRPGKSEL